MVCLQNEASSSDKEKRISIRDYYNGLINENIGDPKKMRQTTSSTQ